MADKVILPGQISRVVNGKWGGIEDLTIINLGMDISGTILSRYYKGIEGDHSMVVVEVTRIEECKTEKKQN